VSSSSDGHRASSLVASPRRELPDVAMCRPFLLGTSARVLRLKPVNPPLMVLRPKPSNRSASSVLHTRPPPFDVCHLHVNTVTSISSYTCRCPKCQPPRQAIWPPGPSVQASRLSFTPPVHQHNTSSLTFTSPSATASMLHTCTTQAKRHVAHKAFAKVGLVTTQPTSWITLTITHHKTNTQGYLSTLCSQSPP
jgi:hypothetical protein